ncbi:MAG: hypothetical protein AAB092_07170 [Chloroflexota bacterium]
MTTPDARNAHADLVFRLAEADQRLLDTVSQRPYLLNPYPSITTRLSRRSRKFRRRTENDGAIQLSTPVTRLYIIDSSPAA